jgi:hypothetical protein
MARKVCPQCKRLTGGSSTTCSGCGHVFDKVIAAPSRRPRRCVMCGIVSHGATKRCECGYEYETDPEVLRQLIAQQRVNGWSLLIGGIVIAIGGLGFPIVTALVHVISVRAMIAVPIVAVAASVGMMRKGTRILDAARANLDDLEGESDALPAARVVASDKKPTTPSP